MSKVMNVEIVSSEMIKPSSPTPSHLKTLELSFLDQLSPTFYVPLTLFYPNYNLSPKTMSHLKNSLSKTLTNFYPLAGRVKDFKHVDCNDEGVLYKEARANFHLSEFLENPNLHMLINFMSYDTSSTDLDTKVMLTLQVTIFECGGIVIGMSILHRIVDAVTITMFLKNWAETTLGSDEGTEFDWSTSSSLFPAANSLPRQFLEFFTGKPTVDHGYVLRRFVFDATAIAAIKAKVASDDVPNPTRIEALTSFIWSRLIVDSKALNGTNNMSIIAHAVNLRPRLTPPLTKQTLRNLIWMVVTMFDPSESNPEPQELAELVNEMFVNFNGEVIKNVQGEAGRELVINNSNELIDVYENGDSFYYMVFTSWCNIGFYEIDFGWGKPVWVGPAVLNSGPRSKREVVFLESVSGNGIEMWITDTQQNVGLLENDSEFLTYVTNNPPISA